MGSRTAWKIITNDDAVIWLYSHWGGHSKFADTQNALVACMPRWDDTTYGARSFISAIVREGWSETTGFGITATLANAECPFEEYYFNAEIDFTTQRVTMGSRTWSFSGFITLSDCSGELSEEFWKEEVLD